MKNIYTSNISGVEEYLPREQMVFNTYRDIIKETYKKCGFTEIETPVIYRTEVLLAKAGGDTEKQIYRVFKTGEAADEAKQALRFDNTVPLARYVVKNQDKLKFPFRVAQVARNFRGERAQNGRSREFYQCDIDVIGRNKLTFEYDADVILTLTETLCKMKLPYSIVLRVSNRKILTGFLQSLELNDGDAEKISTIIDRYEKSGSDEQARVAKTKESLSELNIAGEKIEKILRFVSVEGEMDYVENELRRFECASNAIFSEGVAELGKVMGIIKSYGLDDSVRVKADMKIVRGLDYYTGTVFETMLDVRGDKEAEKIGLVSVCSGGRYDNLAECYGNQKFPGVGGSIGLTRLFAILKDKLCDCGEAPEKSVEVAIIPFDERQELQTYAMRIARAYRSEGESAEVVFSGKNMYERKDYAKEVARKFVVVGENEMKDGSFKVQNSEDGSFVESKGFKNGKIFDAV